MNNPTKPNPPNRGFLREIVDFALQNKKWWLLPLLFVFLLFGALLILGGSGSAPFIYKRF